MGEKSEGEGGNRNLQIREKIMIVEYGVKKRGQREEKLRSLEGPKYPRERIWDSQTPGVGFVANTQYRQGGVLFNAVYTSARGGESRSLPRNSLRS